LHFYRATPYSKISLNRLKMKGNKRVYLLTGRFDHLNYYEYPTDVTPSPRGRRPGWAGNFFAPWRPYSFPSKVFYPTPLREPQFGLNFLCHCVLLPSAHGESRPI
jgi:hypothetical protein